MKKLTIEECIKKVRKCYPILGWICGTGGFRAWKDEKIYININTKRNKFTAKERKAIKKVFSSKKIIFFERDVDMAPNIIIEL